MKKKRIAIIISIILVLAALTITGSYALFYRENIAQMKESYSTGLLSIVAKSKTDNINLDNALPITDEEGVLTDPYVFTIENIGNLDYQFDVRLLSTSDNPIEAQYIKLQIDDGEVTTLSALPDSKIKSDIVLKAKESIDISIRVWLDWNTPNSQIGKVFNSKIITEGKAIYTENNNKTDYVLSEYIKKLYKENKNTTVTNNEIEYQYATSVNLMNDRLGGTTTSLDGGNIRYYGASPNNYIDIGDRTTENEIILYRIIGVFDGKVKVVRNESIGTYSWDSSVKGVNGGYGINQWGPSGNYNGADLMKLLNPGFESEQIGGSLWWNSGSGTCYYSTGNLTIDCDFISIGLSDDVKRYIDDETWYLGGYNATYYYSNQLYNYERGSTVVKNTSDNVIRTTKWIGKIAIIYPSDYGYAVDFGKCNVNLSNYSVDNCLNNNWLSKERLCFLTPLVNNTARAWVVDAGGVFYNYIGTSGALNIYPTFYLKFDTILYGGTGTQTDPYIIR